MESGEVMWTGTAHYPQAINNPEAGIVYLTQSAIIKGLCPPGFWKDKLEKCDARNFWGTGRIGYDFERQETSEGRQLVVIEILPNSPAEQAGLKVGDVLRSCNGKSGFQNKLQYHMKCKFDAGQPVLLEVKRGNKLTTISATAISRQE